MMTGTLINYYFICKRKCYLYGHRLAFESGDCNTSVTVGRLLHEKAVTNGLQEIGIAGVKLDELTETYVVEKKKSHVNVDGARYQLLFYLDELEKLGIHRDGCLWYLDDDTQEILSLSEDAQRRLSEVKQQINFLLNQSIVPDVCWQKSCANCAYFEYCAV